VQLISGNQIHTGDVSKRILAIRVEEVHIQEELDVFIITVPLAIKE
jgi:hypothetical protein